MCLFVWCNGNAKSVQVIGSFNDWGGKPTIMQRIFSCTGSGYVYMATVWLPAGSYQYKFLVDGEEKVDPTYPIMDDILIGEHHSITLTNPSYTEAGPVNPCLFVEDHGILPPAPGPKSPGMNQSPGLKGLCPEGSFSMPDLRIADEEETALVPKILDFDLGPDVEISVPLKWEGNHPERSGSQGFRKNISHKTFELAEKIDESRRHEEFGISLSDNQPRARLCRSFSESEDCNLKSSKQLQHEIGQMMVRERTLDEDGGKKGHDINHMAPFLRREGKMIVALVGLPARGKSYISRTLSLYFNWSGVCTKTYNCGDYRRKFIGVHLPSNFYDPENSEGRELREKMADLCLTDCLEGLVEGGVDICFFDATNSTRARRQKIANRVAAAPIKISLLFIESLCDDDTIIDMNITSAKLVNQEYRSKDRHQAVKDFQKRVDHYKKTYETLDLEEGYSYIKNIDVGKQIICYRVGGYVQSKIMKLVANMHIMPRKIWLSRHGQSEFNVQGRIGGNSGLSALGQIYAEHLTAFFRERYNADNIEGFAVWTSTLRRTGMTTRKMADYWDVLKYRALDEIDAGMMDGMTYKKVAEDMPQEYDARKKDKLNYRYPRGESYKDLFIRVEPVLFEMMRQTTPLLIVGHQAVLRVIYGYLTGKRPEDCPTLDMPLHTIIELKPQGNSCEEVWHSPMSTEDPMVVSQCPRRNSEVGRL